ncbi:hypothetical protein C8E00_102282 [Chromohalobacter marismortui]|uniref:Uncharacterized protein n=1 Tax=Chromohalobacter marismortui TaxID=42055 RepID=A0A4R7NSW0_9GAMM|nr:MULTISPECIES: hypothetical protein [Chromohalobacter]MCI0509325.1 transposase [Chromohalobacter sp.]MCI0592330.1 transposase [Chromohalobacter sp.]TDU23782.1 hypothetical protein C8E00_102282 [Chromohalobacter marismortui]
MQAPTSPDCPECGSRAKRFPPGREGQYHVFCEDCGHDFGRYDRLVADYRHALEELESHLETSPGASRDA